MHNQRTHCVETLTTAVLNCIVIATPNVEITWLKHGQEISKANHPYINLQKMLDNITTSTLLIYDTTTADEGWYTCLASSSALRCRIHIYVTVSNCGMLLPPVSLTVSYVT